MNTAPSSTPRFRTDLVAQPIDNDGQRFVDVTDPDSGKTFRFYEVEYSIACAMNGQRSVGGLASWALEELGLETSSDELQTVITTLDELGYLDSQGAAAAAPAAAASDEVELGHAGGSSRPAIAVAPPPVDELELELGLPGKSSIARERPAPIAAEPVELGSPGAPMFAADAASPAASARTPVDPGTDDDMSFEGLLDATGVTRSPLSADDAPTALRTARPQPAADDFGLDGLTPPPAEVPSASLRPSTSPASDDDGPTNLPPPAPGLEVEDVSVDLSEHLSIGADDLKEAVRQSQVMQAVDVPAELLAELEGKKPEPEVRVASPSPLAKSDVKQAPAPAAEDTSKPIELPAKPAKVSKSTATEPPPQREEPRSSAGILLMLLVIVLAGAGAAYYFLVYKKQQEKESGKTPITSVGPTAPVAPTPPPAPAKPTATLATTAGPTSTITMPAAGAIEWIIDDGAEVVEGDALVRLKGYARLEKKANDYDVRGMQYQEKLDRAKASLETAADAAKPRLEKDIASYESKVEEKATLAQATRDEAAKLTIAAPADGTVKVVGKAGAWTKAGEPLVELAGTAVLTATFDVPADKALKVGDPAMVRKPGGADTDMNLACDVIAVEGTKVTVTCPGSPTEAEAPKAGDPVELR